MSAESGQEAVPATERSVVGLCHALNDQLAGVEAHVYLLEKRGRLEGSVEPLRAHLDRLAHLVRMVRVLCREPDPEVTPFGITVLAETATELMADHPDGAVGFTYTSSGESGVLRSDWGRTVHATVIAGAWVTRETLDPVMVRIRWEEVDGQASLVLSPDRALGEPSDPRKPGTQGLGEIRIEADDPRTARIVFATG